MSIIISPALNMQEVMQLFLFYIYNLWSKCDKTTQWEWSCSTCITIPPSQKVYIREEKIKILYLEHLDTPPRKLVMAFVWSLLSTCKKVICFMAPSLLQEISQKVAFKRNPQIPLSHKGMTKAMGVLLKGKSMQHIMV